jgi:hypothetical protein
LLPALVALACVADDGSGNSGDSTGAAGTSGDSTIASDDSGPTPPVTSDGSSGSPSTTASDDTTGGSGNATGMLDDSSGESGPACDPAEVTEVRDCPEIVGEGFCSEGAEHVPDGSDIAWMSDPPHSGPHYPMWETWGEHDMSVPRGNWVHNLEHGGIVLTYLCPGGCEAELDVLREVIAARPDLRILLTADPLLPGPRFAAISWTWIHRTDTPDLDTLLCFVDQHENHAPEDVP